MLQSMGYLIDCPPFARIPDITPPGMYIRELRAFTRAGRSLGIRSLGRKSLPLSWSGLSLFFQVHGAAA